METTGRVLRNASQFLIIEQPRSNRLLFSVNFNCHFKSVFSRNNGTNIVFDYENRLIEFPRI